MPRPRTSGSIAGTAVLVIVGLLVVGGGTYFFGLTEPLARLFESREVPVPPSDADASDADLIALGKRVYEENCASCHGVNLEGQPNWRSPLPNGRFPAPPHDDGGHTWHHDDQTLFAITKFGAAQFTGLDIESDMPVYEGILSDEEIWASLAYIKQSWSEEIRARNAEINRRAESQSGN